MFITKNLLSSLCRNIHPEVSSVIPMVLNVHPEVSSFIPMVICVHPEVSNVIPSFPHQMSSVITGGYQCSTPGVQCHLLLLILVLIPMSSLNLSVHTQVSNAIPES